MIQATTKIAQDRRDLPRQAQDKSKKAQAAGANSSKQQQTAANSGKLQTANSKNKMNLAAGVYRGDVICAYALALGESGLAKARKKHDTTNEQIEFLEDI